MAYSNVSCISLDLREKKNLFKFIKVILTAVEDNVQEVQGVLQDFTPSTHLSTSSGNCVTPL